MKKVLIALDYDPPAQKIAETGYALAKDMQAEVVLLHVVAEAFYYTSSNYSPIMGYEGFNNLDIVAMANVGELRKAAGDYLNKTKQHLNDSSVQTIVKEGDFANGILEAAKEVSADVIVMGRTAHLGMFESPSKKDIEIAETTDSDFFKSL